MKIRYHISDRFGGVSQEPYNWLNLAYHSGDDPKKVAQNRQILFKKLGISQAQFANQIHSTRVLLIDDFITPPPECDGFITTKANLPLAIMSADCFGVLLFDSTNHIIAALHAGRAGATQGIVKKALKMMRSLGAKEIEAILSPGIHQCCYEISAEMASQYPKRFIKNGRFLDIKQIIYEDLQRGGVESIKDYNICTCCDERYYSYRREGVTGRFVSIIWMEER